MKTLSILCVTISIGLSMTAAFGRGGMASHAMSPVTGGAFGTSAAAPGTNSLGTALSSSGMGDHPMKGAIRTIGQQHWAGLCGSWPKYICPQHKSVID